MGRDKGYILLYRDIQDNALWTSEPFSKSQAWIDLLLLANYESKTFILGNESVKAEIGSVITSELKLMTRWKWSKEKVRNFLKFLERQGMIERKPDRKKTVIVINNYAEYQTAYKTKTIKELQQNQTAEQTAENTISVNRNEAIQTTLQTTNRPQTDHEQTTDHTQTIQYKNIINTLQKNDNEAVHLYGEYENVLLSDVELNKLKSEYPSMWKSKLEALSSYMKSTGKSYKNHYVTIVNWIRKDTKKGDSNVNEHQRAGYDSFEELLS